MTDHQYVALIVQISVGFLTSIWLIISAWNSIEERIDKLAARNSENETEKEG